VISKLNEELTILRRLRKVISGEEPGQTQSFVMPRKAYRSTVASGTNKSIVISWAALLRREKANDSA
jgi:hypothetical protein